MDRAAYIISMRADTELLVTTVAGHLDRPVPTCPGWTCERLAGHLGRVQRWTAGWIRSGEATEVERPPGGEAVLGWVRDGIDGLVEALEATDPDAPMATWAGEQPGSFWPRRMALEAALHRVDAQLAVGAPTPVATGLALDGIAELFAVIAPWRGTGDLEGTGQTLHLHATDPDLDAHDSGGEWLVTLAPGGLRCEHVHAKADVAVRGRASDLLLLLWNRVGPERCEVFGDSGLLDRWRAAVTV